jgi:hypothetical protein
MTAILPHPFDGSRSEMSFETQRNHRFLSNQQSKFKSSIAESSVGPTQRRHHSAIMSNVVFGGMAAIVGTAFVTIGDRTKRGIRISTNSKCLEAKQ